MAENFAEHPNGNGLVKYMLIFAPAWHAWSDLRELMNSYYTDDLMQRCLILWIMALLILYGNNCIYIDGGPEHEGTTEAALARRQEAGGAETVTESVSEGVVSTATCPTQWSKHGTWLRCYCQQVLPTGDALLRS